MIDDRDIPPDAGKAPPFAKPEPGLGAIGTGGGYSGQEYDSAGQQEWRDAQRDLQVAPTGEARGTGSPGEEFDPATSGGTEESPVGVDANQDSSQR